MVELAKRLDYVHSFSHIFIPEGSRPASHHSTFVRHVSPFQRGFALEAELSGFLSTIPNFEPGEEETFKIAKVEEIVRL